MVVRFDAGLSVQGRCIRGYELRPDGGTPPDRYLLLLGQVHGDEPQGRWLLRAKLGEWRAKHPLLQTGLVVIPQVNPDGGRLRERVNANGVDLNRNMPTRDWKTEHQRAFNNSGPEPASEPETRALLGLFEKYQPAGILSIHAMRRYQINCNGPAMEWCRSLESACGYIVTDDIGYPCPGSLGTYAGEERQIPTITLEVDSKARMPDVLRVHLPVMDAALRWWES